MWGVGGWLGVAGAGLLVARGDVVVGEVRRRSGTPAVGLVWNARRCWACESAPLPERSGAADSRLRLSSQPRSDLFRQLDLGWGGGTGGARWAGHGGG